MGGGEGSPRQAAGPDSAEPAGSQQIPLKQPPGTCAVGGVPLPARTRCMHIQACGSREVWQAARWWFIQSVRIYWTLSKPGIVRWNDGFRTGWRKPTSHMALSSQQGR